MAGGFGELLGGIGGIASSIINSGNQARANDIAEQNSIMQMMLGNRNINVQERLGTRNIDLQEDLGNKNFNLQKTSGDRSYGLAKEFGDRNLTLQENAAKTTEELAKASKFDAQGNEVYYDPITKSFKIRLAQDQQRLMDANKLEQFRRSTLDQEQRRRGLDRNEENRNTAQSMLADAVRDFKYGRKPVNQGELTNQLVQDARETRDENLKSVRQAMVTNALRTNNSSSIDDIGQKLRGSGAQAFGSDLADARLKGLQTATTLNNQDDAVKSNRVNLMQTLARYAENPDMGSSPGFATSTAQADAGGGLLSKAISTNAAGVGGAISGEGNALISALSNGAAAQGGAITNSANSQGNAINNLMSALSNAYTSEASGLGSAMSQQAKLLSSQKMDLSGLGKIGSGLGGLFAALGTTDDSAGGTTTINKTGGRTF